MAALLLPAAGCAGESPVGTVETVLPDVSIDDVQEEHYAGVVAIVNDVPVYRSTYEEILTFLRNQIEAAGPGEGSVERYLRARTDALERAIDMELLYQEAVRQGYGLTPEDLRAEYARRVAMMGSEEEYLEWARGHLMTKSEVLDTIRHEMSTERYLAGAIESRLSVTEDEAREYYNRHPEPFTTERTLDLGSIFVDAPSVSPKQVRAAALTRISNALGRIMQGEPFERVAREVSEDGVAHLGGRLGVVKRESLPAPLDEAAFSLDEGEVSTVLETEDGYHLLKVYRKHGGDLKPFEAVADDVRRRVLTRKKSEVMVGVVAQLKAAASITRQHAAKPDVGSDVPEEGSGDAGAR